MKASEIREKSDEELASLESDLRSKLVNLRVAGATNRSVNTAQFRALRADIARIKTVLTERQSQAAAEG